MACSKDSCNDGTVNGTELCEDLLLEIVTKLPPKPFFRSKCLSKAWHRLISSDVSRKLPFTISGIYYDPSSKSSNNLTYSYMLDGKFSDSDLSFLPFHSSSRIISCCNGLLLLFLHHFSKFQVCNPAIRRWTTFPSPHKESLFSVLAFDPSLSPYFKVICFMDWRAQGSELEVFSSKTGAWVNVTMNWGVDPGTFSAAVCYYNGVLHILSNAQCIVGIELEKMTCFRIELPESVRHEACVGMSGGRLQYYSGCDDDGHMRIWMLDDYDKGLWVLKHSTCDFSYGQQMRFLSFHPAKEIFYLSIDGKLLSYDLDKKMLKDVWEYRKEGQKCYVVQIWLFPFSQNMVDCVVKCVNQF